VRRGSFATVVDGNTDRLVPCFEMCVTDGGISTCTDLRSHVLERVFWKKEQNHDLDIGI
jgi:hypothetical protein